MFAPRCPIAEDRCREAAPPAFDTGPDRTSRCFLHEQAPRDCPGAPPSDVSLPGPVEEPEPILTVRGLSKTFTQRSEAVKALVGVDLTLQRGETLGLVGESGSGKTTLARALLGLIAPDEGSVIELDGPAAAARMPGSGLGSSSSRCRSCSRTRTRRSTAGTRCGA